MDPDLPTLTNVTMTDFERRIAARALNLAAVFQQAFDDGAEVVRPLLDLAERICPEDSCA
jgi:hypothetical protein